MLYLGWCVFAFYYYFTYIQYPERIAWVLLLCNKGESQSQYISFLIISNFEIMSCWMKFYLNRAMNEINAIFYTGVSLK
jgi:hypothetical protein